MTDLEKQLEQLVERVVRKVLAETQPLTTDEREKIAEELSRVLCLYSGYRVDYRSVTGAIMDVLDIVAPSLATEIRDEGAHDPYMRRWGDT